MLRKMKKQNDLIHKMVDEFSYCLVHHYRLTEETYLYRLELMKGIALGMRIEKTMTDSLLTSILLNLFAQLLIDDQFLLKSKFHVMIFWQFWISCHLDSWLDFLA